MKGQIMEKEEFLKVLSDHPEFLPETLLHLYGMLTRYKEYCEKQNNILLREALGDAVHLLGMKRKPDKDMVKKLSTRIKEAIYPNGIQPFHHQGEINFYEKYLKEKEE